jgi:hypothetical protein
MYVLLTNIFHLLYVFKTNVTIHLSVHVYYLVDDAEPGTVGMFLEAYLLWLFGFVTFFKATGDGVSKYVIPYARMSVEAPLDAVAQISWGSAVLSAMYRGLCTTVSKGKSGILIVYALLLQFWIPERSDISRPLPVRPAAR